MRFINNFFNHFTNIILNFLASASSTSTNLEYTTATNSALSGTAEICERDTVAGSISLTSASAMTSTISDINAANYNKNITHAYIESMDINELKEFRDELINIKFCEEQKVLKKTPNNIHGT